MLGFELCLGSVPWFPLLSDGELCIMSSWLIPEGPHPSGHPLGPTPAAQLCQASSGCSPYCTPGSPLPLAPDACGASPRPARVVTVGILQPTHPHSSPQPP